MAFAPPHRPAVRPAGVYDPQSPDNMRMTPMEYDLQLQTAELVFRSILEGKRLRLHPSDNAEDWQREVLGESWVQRNRIQKQEVLRQMSASGENTPEWLEAQANMSDIAWEILESGNSGEKLRRLKDVDHIEVVESLKELCPKVRDSYYARCGAGDHLFGLRACIGIFRLFMFDPDVLELCASCLKYLITDHKYNRDGLAEISLPMPPSARGDNHVDKGWSFLRAALDAYMVQGGAEPFSWRPGGEENDDDDEDAEDQDGQVRPAVPVDHAPRRNVAIKIVECILAAKGAPSVVAQLALLREPLPAGTCQDSMELKCMLPRVYAKTQELLDLEPNPVLRELIELLQSAGAAEQPLASLDEDEGANDGGDSAGVGDPGRSRDAVVLRGLAAGVRGILGRGAAGSSGEAGSSGNGGMEE